jgi:ribosome-associated toxin RatA of RatAB toxin-antitoxin module
MPVPPFFRQPPVAEVRACWSNSRRISLCLILVLLSIFGTAQSAEAFSVDTTRHGDAVQVRAHATIKAPLAVIWNTLTDYDHLAEFVPGMVKSKLIERKDKTSIVEQSGYAHLWFFRFPINVTVEATEHSTSMMTVHLIKGNLKRLEGSYELEKTGDADTYHLRWTGTIEPASNVPTAIAAALMRKNISEQFRGMVDEIERRAALQPRVPAE